MFAPPSRLENMEIFRLASLVQLHRLTAEQLAQLAPHASERVIPAGRRQLLSGRLTQEIVLIAAGRGAVRCAGETVRELRPGDIFGEPSADWPSYDTAMITAATDLRLIVFGPRALGLLRDAAPEAVAGLLAACAVAPPERAGTHAEPRPASRLTLVRSSAA